MNNPVIRAKDIKSGKWVKGDLVHNKKVTRTGLEPRTMVGGYEVDPKTVGFFTGVLDIKGNKIFDGDILQVMLSDGQTIYKLVKFQPNKAGFCIANIVELQYEGKWDVWNHISQQWVHDVEPVVVGNVHDNPELL